MEQFKGRPVWQKQYLPFNSETLVRSQPHVQNQSNAGLFPSLNRGAVLHRLAATKITGKDIHGRKSSPRCKVEAFV